MSRFEKFLGAGKCTISPSSNRSMSAHAIMEGFHRKSFNIIISASSAPTQAKVPVAGLQKVPYMLFNGASTKLFPQLATPCINRFLYFPLPFSSNVKTAWAKTLTLISFLFRRLTLTFHESTNSLSLLKRCFTIESRRLLFLHDHTQNFKTITDKSSWEGGIT